MLTVEEQIERLADAAIAESRQRVVMGHEPTNRSQSHRRVRTLVGAAATILVVALVGAFALGLGQPSTPSVDEAPETRTRRPLGTATVIGESEWLLVAESATGLDFLFALAPSLGDSERTIWYGQNQDGISREQMRLSLGPDEPVQGGEPVEIAGAEWTVSAAGASWTSTRRVGGTVVSVSAPGIFDDEARELIAGLDVGPESELPSIPLAGERAEEVTAFDFEGRRISLAAQESNGYWCFETRSGTGSTSGCGAALDPAADITFDTGGTTTTEGSDTAEVVRGGTVTSRAARIEAEFADGAVVSATPQDRTGQFARKFWLVATVINRGSATGRSPGDAFLTEVRVYDADGQLLASESPP